MAKCLYLTNELAGDCARFIDNLAEQFNYDPVAELRLGHEVVKELIELANQMKGETSQSESKGE